MGNITTSYVVELKRSLKSCKCFIFLQNCRRGLLIFSGRSRWGLSQLIKNKQGKECVPFSKKNYYFSISIVKLRISLKCLLILAIRFVNSVIESS